MRNALIIFCFLLSILSYGQNIDFRIDFFKKQILKDTTKEIIVSKNASSKIYELFFDKQKGFDYEHLLFSDNIYYSDSIWKLLLTESDIEYIYKQIEEYKNFKWTSDKLPSNVILYSKNQVRKYSRKTIKINDNKTDKDFKFVFINSYSLPLFNLNNSFAIIYCRSYCGPLSASTYAEIYRKIDGVWKKIGVYIYSIS